MLKRLIAVAALVSILALAGCAQGQASTSSGASPKSAGASSGSAVSAAAPSSTAGTSNAASEQSSATAGTSAHNSKASTSLVMRANDTQLSVTLADTDAARALAEQLQAGPVTVSLHAYGGFEQVGPLPWSLPAGDEQITTSPGDIMLYQGNQITIFTGSNSWAYTPLGTIEDTTPDTLLEAFGGDSVEITLSLA